MEHPTAQEIRLARIRCAQHALAHTDQQIVAIAMNSGFQSVSRFNRAFLEKVGVTPSKYRRQFTEYRSGKLAK